MIDEGVPMGTEKKVSDLVAVSKDVVSLLRDLALFIIALLLIAFPAVFNSVLERAGFEEGSFAGLKWRSKLVASDAALKEARAAIGDVQQRNDEMAKALGQAREQVKDPGLRADITRLEQDSKRVEAATRQVQSSVSDTIASNAPLVNRVLAAGDGRWGVVWGGDSSLEAARFEIEKVAPKLQLPNPAIYFRQGWYRSISVAGDRQEADQILGRAKMRRSDAYIVNMTAWCPKPDPKPGYFDCTGN
jgi:hypothetical protein